MSEHPEFDKWWKEHGQFVRAGGGQYEISFAFAAWNASRSLPANERVRDEAYERAAKVCGTLREESKRLDPWAKGYRCGAADCEDTIRALIGKGE